MKPAMFLPVISGLLVFAAISAPDTVCGNPFESTSNEVWPGVPYYILPAMYGAGGGLYPENLKKRVLKPMCPLDPIIQSSNLSHKGVPVLFTPQNRSERPIPLNHNLNIHFNCIQWFCPESKVWRVKFSPRFRWSLVTTGGTFGGSDSWFRIERDGSAFKLVHCPRGVTPCRDVGIKTFDKAITRYLALSNPPFAVKFEPLPLADPSEESITEEAKLRMFPSY